MLANTTHDSAREMQQDRLARVLATGHAFSQLSISLPSDELLELRRQIADTEERAKDEARTLDRLGWVRRDGPRKSEWVWDDDTDPVRAARVKELKAMHSNKALTTQQDTTRAKKDYTSYKIEAEKLKLSAIQQANLDNDAAMAAKQEIRFAVFVCKADTQNLLRIVGMVKPDIYQELEDDMASLYADEFQYMQSARVIKVSSEAFAKMKKDALKSLQMVKTVSDKVRPKLRNVATLATKARTSYENMRKFENALMNFEFEIDYDLRKAIDRLVATRLVKKEEAKLDAEDRHLRYGVYSGGSDFETLLTNILKPIQLISKPFDQRNRAVDVKLAGDGRNQGGRLVKWFPEHIAIKIEAARTNVESSFTVAFAEMDAALTKFRKYESATAQDLQKIQNDQATLNATYLQVASTLVAKLRGYEAPKDLLHNPPTEERGDGLPSPQEEYFVAHVTEFNANQTFKDHIEDIDLAFRKLNNAIASSEISIRAIAYKTPLYPP